MQIRDIIEKDFSKWTLKDIRGFMALLNQSNRAVWTKKCILITLGMFIRWKFKNWPKKFDDLKDMKKAQKLLKPDNEEKYADLPTAEDIDKMVRSALFVRDKVYVSMGAEAGLPPVVETTLKWQNLKFDEPELGFTTLTYHRGKNKTTFIFPLGKQTTYYLKQWKQEFQYPNIREDDYIFPSPQNRDKPLSRVTTNYMLKRLAKKAGVSINIFQYKLRHKTLSDNYDILTEEVHRKLYGHVKGSSQTKTYSHRKDKEKTLAIAMNLLHKVEKVTKEQQNKYDKRITSLEKKYEKLIRQTIKDQQREMEGIKRQLDLMGEVLEKWK